MTDDEIRQAEAKTEVLLAQAHEAIEVVKNGVGANGSGTPVQQRRLLDTTIIFMCATVLCFMAFSGMYLWGRDAQDQARTLRSESTCRSEIAADTDVAQGDALVDAIDAIRTTSRALRALGTEDRVAFAGQLDNLERTANAIDESLGAYIQQIAVREETTATCAG